MPEIARQCSERERAADEAERETEDLKKVEYMKEREGDIFEGIISNVTSFGMFIELGNTIEGLVRMSSMEDDYYIFNEKHYCLVGERSRKIYRIGDTVKVKLAKADITTRKIDFMLLDGEKQDIDDLEDIEEEEIAIQDKPKRAKNRKKGVDKKVLVNIMGKKKKKKKKD